MKPACAFLILWLSVPPLFAADPSDVPAGSSAEVIEAKAREKAKEKLEEKIPEAPKIEAPEAPPKKADETAVFIRRIRLRFHESVPQKEAAVFVKLENFRDRLAPYENRSVTFSEVTALTKELESALREKGFFAVVRVPPQDIRQGELVLEVLLSRMGDLSMEGPHYFRKRKTLSYWTLPAGQILRYDAILASVLAMNENPDREVKPLLQAGKTVGTTDVILKSEERFPLHAGYSFDNQGVKLTGRERQGFTLRHNNILTLDDIFLIGTVFGNTYGAVFLQHILPLNSRGTRFVWGVSHAQVNPKKEFKEFGINGISQTYSMSLRQKLLQNRSTLANAYIGLNFKERSTHILSVTSVWDRLRVLSFGGDLQKKDAHGLWTLNQDFYFGFSPHGDGFALTSRRAESNFLKYGFSFQRQQILPFGSQAHLKFQGQLSPDKLTSQEEFYLGGSTTVRGYPETDYAADQALLASGEYLVPFFAAPKSWKLPYSSKTLREQIQLIGFFDYGYGRLRDPSERESRTRRLIGVGGGFAISLRENLSARFEWGAPLGEEPLTESGEDQFHFRFQANL